MRSYETLARARGALFGVAILMLPIFLVLSWRGFYAMNVDWYQLDTYIGASKEELLEAYDQMMDYCMGYSDEFSVGIFPYSEDGAEHFEDVRAIFIFISDWAKISTIIYILIVLAQRKTDVKPYRIRGRKPEFWGVVGVAAVVAVVGALAALDFSRAFTVFHMIFFPGQSNWLFNPATDPVIYALPEEFFRNCGILIGGLILLGCAIIMIFELVDAKKAKPES